MQKNHKTNMGDNAKAKKHIQEACNVISTLEGYEGLKSSIREDLEELKKSPKESSTITKLTLPLNASTECKNN